VDYSDSLTEKQWLKAIEDGTFDEGDSFTTSRSSRKKKGKRSRDADDDDDDDKPKKKRGRPSTNEKLPPNPPKLTALMRRLMSEIVNYVDAEDRSPADAFLELPSRKELPDYYDVIRKPMDIKKIRAKITVHKYRCLDDVEADFNTMCQNAQTYNVEGSQIFEDSLALQIVFKEIRERLEKEEAEKAARGEADDDEDDEESDEESSDEDEDEDVQVASKGKTKASTSKTSTPAKKASSPSNARRPRQAKTSTRYVSDDDSDETDD